MEKLSKPPEEEVLSATDDQLSVARVCGFFRQLTIIDSMAKSYADWQMAVAGREGKQLSAQEVKTDAVDIFFRLHFECNQDKLEKFRKDFGIKAEGYERLYSDGKKLMDRVMQEEEGKAISITKQKKRETLIREILFIITNPHDKRMALMKIAGNSAEQIERYRRSLSLSAKFILPLEFGIAGVNVVALTPFVGGPDDPDARATVVSAYAYNAIATIINTIQNYRAIHTEKLAISPNILVTSVYDLVKEQFPNDDFFADISVIALSTIPIIIPELFLSMGIVEGEHGTSAAVARNIFAGVNQLVQALYVEHLRRKAIEENKE